MVRATRTSGVDELRAAVLRLLDRPAVGRDATPGHADCPDHLVPWQR